MFATHAVGEDFETRPANDLTDRDQPRPDPTWHSLGLAVNGRNAQFRVTDKDLTDMKKMKALGEQKSFKIVAKPSQMPAAEIRAFQIEMDAAKKAWAKRVAEAKAAAEKKEDK